MCGFLAQSDSSKLEDFKESFEKIHHRGPDHSSLVTLDNALLGFHRLSIMDLSPLGNQPFYQEEDYLICNGEIYNYQELIDEIDFNPVSESDCEILLPLYHRFGLKKMVEKLDAEFAFVIYDHKRGKLLAARDPIGIRPLFYGTTEQGNLCFGSEVKALQHCSDIKPFPPGHYYDGKEFHEYIDHGEVKGFIKPTIEEAAKGINKYLSAAVLKRLQSDAPLGFLLSGGLDSSLVCAIAAKHSDKPLTTFSIGMDEDAIDLKYAKIVADHIGSVHHEVIITKDDVLGALRDVIWHLETYDITTVRASIGMYLVCKYVKEKTDLKVILTGEVSDEIFGYKYTDFAPDGSEFQKEAAKRVRELYIYDVLRADRCISAHSLEARVPFSDKDFVDYVMSLDPELKMNFTGKGKYLLRKAFEEGDYLPEEILWREKAAFSDAVGHSMVDYLKAYAEECYTDQDYSEKIIQYKHARPFTKESLLYREIFEEFYPGQAKLIKDFWMPNKLWKNCDVSDPSARVLPNYGQSGS